MKIDPFSLVLTSGGSIGSCDSARLLKKLTGLLAFALGSAARAIPPEHFPVIHVDDTFTLPVSENPRILDRRPRRRRRQAHGVLRRGRERDSRLDRLSAIRVAFSAN